MNVINCIKECQKCNLYINQTPLIDRTTKAQVFFVGISAKIAKSDDEMPLSPTTNSGMLIQKVEELCPNIGIYKTNLVKCVPLDDDGKLRYPTKEEINHCFENLLVELQEIKPKIVFLLGNKVISTIESHMKVKFSKWDGFDFQYKKINGIYYIPIQHPSYIYVYKRKQIEEYVNAIVQSINKIMA